MSNLRKLNMDELNRLSVEAFHKTEKLPVTVVLDNIRSCHNIGSVFRTADAFIVEQILLCGITATPPNKEIHKAALDAEKSVKWSYLPTTLHAVNQLREEGYQVWAVEQVSNSVSLPDFIPEQGAKIALVFGNEVKGVDQQVIDRCHGAIEIPQFGTKHSLNISVSAGIVLWEVTRKMNH
ncbi:MAG TPA: RNA methyltransferase [Prolixibacteraceae bacterium]|nr:RNA methyltransferase [Prolixibacteraceae bacterium]